MIKLDISKALENAAQAVELKEQVAAAQEALENGTCPGNDFLGWLHLPSSITAEFLNEIKACAEVLRSNCDTVVVAGIGGSYLGARAVIEALGNSFAWLTNNGENPNILFAGNNIGEDYLYELTQYLKGRNFGVINISKSGTTTETALAFRLLKKQCEEQRGKEMARKVIVAVTDAKKGAARTTADKEGYTSFIIPDNVGGRFSVLTPVGLLPIAVAGCDIAEMMKGAADAAKALADPDLEKNPCYKYAAIRNIMYRKGKSIEILASYEPSFVMMGEWFKQLYGESEGKDQKGLFPASVAFSTDLHSMGQMIQDGCRNIFETVVDFKTPQSDFFIKEDEENADGLNFLANQNMSVVNRKALEGTVLAHVEGGTPNVLLEVPEINEYEFGWMVYFFEKACAISGYMLAVNPFDQPGVEGYKKNMFALLGKPGFEERRAMLEAQLK
ncbi:MAG: glucose-6-phosphate isomerase [Bacteroidaceae bacterium]|nr:glucose-6-phosphate isomerase [Bacteroidaceae bacterium]